MVTALAVASDTVRSFDTSSPLKLSDTAIRAGDLVPEHGTNVWCTLRQDTLSCSKVFVLVTGVDSSVSSIPIVVGLWNLSLLDNNIGVGVVVKALAYRQIDPLATVNHAGTIFAAGLDDVELVSWSNTRSHEDLACAKDACGEDDSASVWGDVDCTAVASLTISSDFDTSNVATVAKHLLNGRVHPELKVAAGVGFDQVGCHWSEPLAVVVHVWCV